MTLCGDLAAVNTHLHELVGNCVGAALREALVDRSVTCSAVSITIDLQLGTVLLGILSQSLDVHEILLRSDVGLVDVEEHRDRSVNKLLHSLVIIGLVSEQVLQTSVLSVSVVELSVKSVDLALTSGVLFQVQRPRL